MLSLFLLTQLRPLFLELSKISATFVTVIKTNFTMKIKFKKLDKSVPSPFKKYPSDFCWDLYATSCEEIAPNVYKYGLGIAIEMERDWETILKGSTIDMGLNTDIDLSKCPFHLSLDLRPRSSVWKTGMVLSNCEGTIDECGGDS